MSGVPFCIDCKHCADEKTVAGRIPDTERGFGHYCRGSVNVVTGEAFPPFACCLARGYNAVCGLEGKLFEAKK